ncbi:MAG: hypothetical protein ABFD86_05670 [Bryobacteraceae bacterium]
MRLVSLIAALLLLAGSLAGWLFAVGVENGDPPAPLRFLTPSLVLEAEAADAPQRSGQLLREAVRRDPSSAYRWAALGETYLAAERTREARACMARAAALGPNIPPILIRAANFHFALDEPAAAMSYGRRILALIPDYDAVVFALYDRMSIPVKDVLAKGMPVESRAGTSYFRHRLGGAPADELRTVWQWLAGRGWTDDKLASAYVDQLLARHDYAGAAATWAGHLGKRRGAYPDADRVYNGGFEEESTPAPLDWRQRQADGAKVQRVGGEAHRGEGSLRLDFLGEANVTFDHASQLVVVQPGAYRFRAFLKTDGITTDQGVRFRIADTAAPGRLEAITDGYTGSHGWTEVSRTIHVPAGTNLLSVQVVREASMKFDNKIRGTAWVDDVELTPLR